MIDESTLAEWQRLCDAARSTEEYAAHRIGLTWTPEIIGREAWVLYDDGDLCAAVHDNLGLGFSGDRMAEFFAAARTALPLLIAEVRRLRELEQDAIDDAMST